MAKTKQSWVSWILTLAIAGSALYYSLRGVEWREIARIVGGANAGFLGLVLAISSFTTFLRSARWQVMLGAEEKLPIGLVFWCTALGLLGNNVLPARAGELLRTQMLSARSGLSRSFVLATALAALAMDLIVLVMLSAVVIIALPGTPEWLKKGSSTMGIVGAAGLVILFALPHFERMVSTQLGRIPGPAKLRDRLIGMSEQFLLGLRAFHHLGRFAIFTFLSFTIWLIDAFSAVTLGKALHLEMAFTVALFLLAGLALASAAPSTPGYVGVLQIVAVGILPAFGFSKSDAIAYILVFQALSYVVFTIWGLLGLWRLRHIPVRQPAPDSTIGSDVPKVPEKANLAVD